jgi:hypothetical protein
MTVVEVRLSEHGDRVRAVLHAVDVHIEHQKACAIASDQSLIDVVVSDAADAGARGGSGDDSGNGLLARVEAGRTDGVVRRAPRRQTIGVKLVNRDAVRTTLTDEETAVDAIQRPYLISILAGG